VLILIVPNAATLLPPGVRLAFECPRLAVVLALAALVAGVVAWCRWRWSTPPVGGIHFCTCTKLRTAFGTRANCLGPEPEKNRR